MEEFLSYEECVQLRDAGFPQPSLNKGQVWWVHRSRYRTITSVFKGMVRYVNQEGDLMRSCLAFDSECVYAPTALDILKELGGQYPPFVYYCKNVDLWYCLDKAPRDFCAPPVGFADKSAVVAVKKFYLEQKTLAKNVREYLLNENS